MGFRKSNSASIIPVTRRYNQINDVTGEQHTYVVTHVLKIPTASQREAYDRKAAEVKGKRLRFNRSLANWELWSQICVDVKDYDDIEEQYPRDQTGKLASGWRSYFDDDGVARIHVDDMIETLLEVLSGDEATIQKN